MRQVSMNDTVAPDVVFYSKPSAISDIYSYSGYNRRNDSLERIVMFMSTSMSEAIEEEARGKSNTYDRVNQLKAVLRDIPIPEYFAVEPGDGEDDALWRELYE